MKTSSLLQSQMGVFLEWSQHPEKMVYNIPILLSFPFFVSAEQLKQALVNVLSCHPSLFVRLFEENNRIIQRIVMNDSPQIEIKEISESLLDEEKQIFVHPFKLFDEQLWRARILKGEKKVFLLLDIHHIICDGISINVFLEDLCKVLEGQIIQKESCTICDYAEEQERNSQQQGATDSLFLYSPFDEDELCCNFPTSVMESTTSLDERKEQNIFFSNKDILNDCQSIGIHPSSLIMSAVSYVFGRLSYSKNVCLAAIHSGRLDYRIKGSVGMFVNTFPIVARNEDTTVYEYISSIKNSYRIGKKHPNYSFADAVSSLKVKPDILFVYQIGVVDKFRTYEVSGSPVEFELFLQEEIDFKVIIWIDEKEGAPYIKVKYNSKDFDDAFILQFAKLISDVSDYFVHNPHSDLLSVPLVSEGERRRLIQLGEGEHLDYNQDETLVDLFRSQAQRSPENIAVVSKGEEFTYSQIDKCSNVLANILHHQYRVATEDVVGVMIDRSELMVIYPMSIMKTGGVYMPLDYEHLPSDRLQSMCSDANVKLILTDSADRVAEHLPGYKGEVLCVSTSELVGSCNDNLSFVPSFGPSNRFVILYTSGSTGDPKGCQLEHRGIVNFCHWYVKEFEMTESDKTIAYANFGFDAHMMDIYPALSVGACVHILPNDLRMNLGKMNEYMEKEGISIAFLTTQVGLLFVNEFENRSLRLLSVSGEKLPPLKRPAYKLYNAGAPTECTIYAFFYHIEEEQYIRPIIGKALANCQLYVVDQDLNIQPQGVAGELLIGGRGVCRGYLNKPEETAKRFITYNGERVYRTGDMVRWNEDGLLEYIGRIDKQVKINGYRIELSEIEAQVAQFEGVKQVCAKVEEKGGVKTIICFYSSADDINENDLRDFLIKSLPSYSVPSYLQKIEEFPLNRNGKVDRNKLHFSTVEENNLNQTSLEIILKSIVKECQREESEVLSITTPLQFLGVSSVEKGKLLGLLFDVTHCNFSYDEIELSTDSILSIENKVIDKLINRENVLDEDSRNGIPWQLYYYQTSTQIGLFSDCIKTDTDIYNVPLLFIFNDSYSLADIKHVITNVLIKHPVLFSKLVFFDGDYIIKYPSEITPKVNILESEIDNLYIKKEAVAPFNFDKGPLYRANVFTYQGKPCSLLVFHHIVFDGKSLNVLAKQISDGINDNYYGNVENYFGDYLVHEHFKESSLYSIDGNYFHKLMQQEGINSSTYILPDREVLLSSGSMCEYVVPIICDTTSFCTENGISETTFWLSVLNYVLYRFTGKDKLYLTVSVDARDSAIYQNAVGMFVKTFPFFASVRDCGVHDYVKYIFERYSDAVVHSNYVYQDFVRDVGLYSQINYVYQIDSPQYDGFTIETINPEKVKFKLSICIERRHGKPSIVIQYDSSCYSKSLIENIGVGMLIAAEDFLNHKSENIKDVSILSTTQKELLNGFEKGPDVNIPIKLFHQGIEKWAVETPETCALITDTNVYNYKELNDLSERLSSILLKNYYVNKGDSVILYLPRDYTFILGFLSVLKCGATYIPIDYNYPKHYVDKIVTDSNSQILITTSNKACQFNNALNVELLIETAQNCSRNVINPSVEIKPTDIAYIIYTSGSTGDPKGVKITHLACSNFFTKTPANTVSLACSQRANRMLCQTSFSFDLSVFEYGTALFNGKTLVLANETHISDYNKLADFCTLHQVDGISGTPSRISSGLYVKKFKNLLSSQIKVVMLGGEKVSHNIVDELCALNVIVVNGYGPTETTMGSSGGILSAGSLVHVGKPGANYIYKICDKQGHRLPVGAIGELHIGGLGVSSGYTKTIPEQKNFYEGLGVRFYKSGDLARWTFDGNVIIVGRNDTQIKINGIRIECEEIESCILQIAGVNQCVVRDKKSGNGGNLMVCFYSVADDTELMPYQIKSHLLNVLPKEKIPTRLIKVEKMPITQTGKIDVNALLTMDDDSEEYVMPETPTEELISQLIIEIRSEKYGVTSSLELSSLESITFLSKLQESKYFVTSKDIKGADTIREISEIVDAVNVLEYRQGELKKERKSEELPLMSSQFGIYWECMKNLESKAYNMPILFTFPSSYSINKIEDAFRKCICLYPILFSRITRKDDKLYFIQEDFCSFEVDKCELSDGTINFIDYLHQFNLENGPLFHSTLLSTESKLYLLFDIHHIVCDGKSAELFVKNFLSLLKTSSIQFPEVSSFSEHLLIEAASASGNLSPEHKLYYDTLFDNYDVTTKIESDLPQKPKTKESQCIEKEITFDFTQPCRKLKIEETSFWVASIAYSIYRLSLKKGANDVFFTITLDSRYESYSTFNTLGYFLNTVPLAFHFEKQKISDYLLYSDFCYKQAQKYKNCPFSKIVAEYTFNTTINFTYNLGIQDTINEYQIVEPSVGISSLIPTDVKFPISLAIHQKEGKPYLFIQYDSSIYSRQLMSTFVSSVVDVARYFLLNPHSDLLSVPLVSEGERRRLIQLGEGEHLDYNQDETLVDLFRSQAQRSPENIAVVSKGEEFTYSQIDKCSNVLANILHHQYRVATEDVVGVMIDRSELMVIYPMSIMKTGGVYMPLDYEHLPSDRLQSMCSDANVKLILTDSADRVAEHLPGYKGEVLCVSTSELVGSCNDNLSFVPSFGPSNRFVILYTSGSTGDPKGCQLEHRGIVNFCHWYVKEFEMTESDKTIAYANFGFDAHMMDIYPALSVGACVHILPNDLRMNLGKMNEYMEKEGISIAFLTTQVGLLFVNEFENRSLRLLSVSGEKLPPLKRPAYKLYNAGAPTECTIYAFFYHIEEEQYIRPIIGKALANCQLYVVDQDLNIQPQGVAGELLIGGRGVCRGYLNKPEETAKRFITYNGERVYRTGDMVRWNEDGLLEYIGRIDKQVKINGYRIELSEIEAQVAQFKGIKQVCVEVRRLGKGEKLVCFYSLESSVGVNLDAINSEIKSFIKDRLPSYMIPSIYVQLDEFPSNRNGKVDRSRLALPQNTNTINTDNNTESIIYEIYSKVLGYTNFRKDENFFEIGGDSKSAIELLVYMEKAGYAISYEDIYKFPTVCEMANFIQGETSHQAIEISPDDEIITYLHNTLGCGADFIGLSKNIILTGATGFLGIHILNQLLDNTDSVVYCPIRKSDEKIDLKLNRLYEFYFSKQLFEYYNKRLFLFEGDLAAAAVYCQLEIVLSDSSKTTIINCAANVKHFGLGNTIQQNNVDIVKNIVKLCEKHPSTDLIHMSTLSVAGFQRLNNCSSFSESDLYNGQLIENEYVQSKFESETIILRAMIHNGVRAKILRLGNISPRTYDGGFQFNIGDNAFMNRILSIVKLGKCSFGIANTFVDMSPVDEIAKAVILLSKLKTDRPVFHLYNDNLVPISALLDVMNAQGYDIEISGDKDFSRYLSAHNEKDSMFSMFAYKAKADYTLPCISSFYTNYILHKYNFTWSINGKDYLDCFIKRIMGEKGLN